MKAGKVLPIMGQFFRADKLSSANRDSNSQKDSGQNPEQKASQEDAKRAAEILNQSEEFVKNGLIAEAAFEGNEIKIFVRDKNGAVLRAIAGAAILRVISSTSEKGPAYLGRILDRRI